MSLGVRKVALIGRDGSDEGFRLVFFNNSEFLFSSLFFDDSK